jgi:hypothetical protein
VANVRDRFTTPDHQYRQIDPVHVNAEFADQASDHDPQVARLGLDRR